MKDHFLRWLERGQKEGDRANFLLVFEEIDATGKIHLKNTISNTHSTALVVKLLSQINYISVSVNNQKE